MSTQLDRKAVKKATLAHRRETGRDPTPVELAARMEPAVRMPTVASRNLTAPPSGDVVEHQFYDLKIPPIRAMPPGFDARDVLINGEPIRVLNHAVGLLWGIVDVHARFEDLLNQARQKPTINERVLATLRAFMTLPALFNFEWHAHAMGTAIYLRLEDAFRGITHTSSAVWFQRATFAAAVNARIRTNDDAIRLLHEKNRPAAARRLFIADLQRALPDFQLSDLFPLKAPETTPHERTDAAEDRDRWCENIKEWNRKFQAGDGGPVGVGGSPGHAQKHFDMLMRLLDTQKTSEGITRAYNSFLAFSIWQAELSKVDL